MRQRLFSQMPVANELPFAFKYGRRYSQQLLPKWNTHVGPVVDGRQNITWTDPDTALTITAHVTAYPTGAFEWRLTFTNNGDEPTPILEDIWALRARIPGHTGWSKSALLHRLNGSSCKADDWLPFTTEIPPGSRLKFGPRDGRSSSGACPFFNFEWGDGGVITAIGWTGQWQAEIVWGTVTEIRAGMERLHLSLQPGESIRSPRIMQLYWKGDVEQSYNRFRQTMFEHVLPRVDGEIVVAPIAHLSTAGYEWNQSDEKSVLEHLEATRDLGFETLWLDAYYLKGGGFPTGIGNYELPVTSIVAGDRYPRGLGYIGDRVHEANMEWLVWYCFEGVAPGTWLDRERPEWLLSAGEQEYKLLNLGLPEVREYMTRYFIETVKEHKLDWLRIDCCPATLPFWREADVDPNRVGITETCWVKGLYRFLDDILEACPGLKIDNCDGGGTRIDLEMCSRSTPLWRTDYSTPVQERWDMDAGAVLTQTMIAGLNRYVPFNSCGQFYEEPYWFRSGFNGGIGALEDCRPEFYPRDRMRAAVAEGKRIRKYFFGNFYPLTEVTLDPTTWHVVQYHRPGEGDGMILAFRRHESQDDSFACNLREIDRGGTYEVTWFRDYTPKAQATVAGEVLQALPLRIAECPGSVLVEYKKAQG